MKRIMASAAIGILIATLNGCEMMKASAENQSATIKAGEDIWDNLTPEERKKMEGLIHEGMKRLTPEQTKRFGKALIERLENLSPKEMNEMGKSLRENMKRQSPECAKLDAEEEQLIRERSELGKDIDEKTCPKGWAEGVCLAGRGVRLEIFKHRWEKHELLEKLCMTKYQKEIFGSGLEKLGKRLTELGENPIGMIMAPMTP